MSRSVSRLLRPNFETAERTRPSTSRYAQMARPGEGVPSVSRRWSTRCEVAERLEEHVLMAALEDHAADGVVIPEQEVVEDRAVVLVVDLELGRDVEATGEHVRPRSLQPDEVDRCREPCGARVRPAPLPFRRGDAGARDWIELVLLDQTREAFGPSPAEMAAYPAGEPGSRALARREPGRRWSRRHRCFAWRGEAGTRSEAAAAR